MKALDTGGASFIGSNIISELIQSGYDLTVLDNLSSVYRVHLQSFQVVNFIEGDVRDYELAKKSMKDVDVVFHLVASVGNKRSNNHPLNDSGINHLENFQVPGNSC